jgi:hypothetical protein
MYSVDGGCERGTEYSTEVGCDWAAEYSGGGDCEGDRACELGGALAASPVTDRLLNEERMSGIMMGRSLKDATVLMACWRVKDTDGFSPLPSARGTSTTGGGASARASKDGLR